MPEISNNGPQQGTDSPKIEKTQKKTGFALYPENRLKGLKPREPDQARFELAKAHVENGLTVPKAMIKAGYTKTTAYHSRSNTKNKLSKFRDQFLEKFTKTLKAQGCHGDGMAKRLAKVIQGSDDYNAIQAIRVGTTVMLKNASETEKPANFFGVFVVPDSKVPETWETEARKLQQIQAEALIKEADVIENGDVA